MRARLLAQRSPRSQSIALTVGRIVQGLMAVLAPIVLVRFLDQVDYGIYRKIFLILITTRGLLILSLPESIYYYVSRSGSSCHRLVVRTIVVLSGLGLIAGAIVFFSAGHLERMFEVPLTPYLPWVVAYVALSAPATLAYTLPTVDQRAQLQATLMVVVETLRTLLLTVAVIATGSVEVLVVVLCVYVLIKMVALLVYLPARRSGDSGVDESPGFGDQLRYSIPLWGAALIMIARDQGHALFVAGMFDTLEFAIYAVGTMAIPVLPFINEIIGSVMLIQTARRFREGDLDEMRRVWFRATHNLALALIPVFVVLQIFAHDLVVTLFGTNYADSVPVFRWYLLLVLSLVPQLCSPLLKATGDIRTHFLADLASSVGTVGVLLLATKFWGLYLAALSPAVGYFVFAIAASPTVGKRMSLGSLQIYSFASMAKIASCAVITCLLPWALLLPFGSALRLFVGGPVAGLLFATAAWRFEIIEASERDLVRTSLRRVLPARFANAVIGILGG